jgi:hypothetical protein
MIKLANIIIKNLVVRDELKRDMNILYIEIEAARLINDFLYLVI